MASDRAAGIGLFRRALALCCVIMILTAAQGDATAREPRGEYEVKAAIIYNIVRFVEWPREEPGTSELRICVAGEGLRDPIPFLELQGQQAAGKRIAVRLDSKSLRDCQVLFLAVRDEMHLQSAIRSLSRAPVLTITELPGACLKGSIVNFIIIDKKVGFEINAAAARRAGIRISSKLLKLARSVFDGEEAGD
jgi:hypothetical protein